MKFFLDTANLEDINEFNEAGLLEGITTNPSLIAKENTEEQKLINKICEIASIPISVEVNALNFEDMMKEAIIKASWNDNINIKIPLNSDGIKAVKYLNDKDIKTNATLIFDSVQAMLMINAGASFISPFIGRLDDINCNGMQLIQELTMVSKRKAEIIVASIRNKKHLELAFQYGADIVTIPPSIFRQLLIDEEY